MFKFGNEKRIYLDYAAATPVRKEVLESMRPFFSEAFANPSAIHIEGVAARVAIESAREDVARTLRTRVPDIYFTGSGTESNNIAILGTIAQKRKEGIQYLDMEVISTAIEHPSVSETFEHLRTLGVVVHQVAVDEEGSIDTQAFRELLSSKVVLVTFAYANSEIGTVQPIHKIARIVRAYEKEHAVRIYVHLDAAQAPLWLPCALDQLSVDMLTLDAGKCYGPKGIGILALRHTVVLAATMFGGGQERGIRPGTENTPLIVGATKAITIAQRNYKERAERVSKLRDEGIAMLTQIDGILINGPSTDRIANNINISVPGIDAEFAVITLDTHGVSCSTKSACSGAGGQGSTVVQHISGDIARATSTLRFTLGEETNLSEIKRTIDLLNKHIIETRGMHKKLTSN